MNPFVIGPNTRPLKPILLLQETVIILCIFLKSFDTCLLGDLSTCLRFSAVLHLFPLNQSVSRRSISMNMSNRCAMAE